MSLASQPISFIGKIEENTFKVSFILNKTWQFLEIPGCIRLYFQEELRENFIWQMTGFIGKPIFSFKLNFQ